MPFKNRVCPSLAVSSHWQRSLAAAAEGTLPRGWSACEELVSDVEANKYIYNVLVINRAIRGLGSNTFFKVFN